MPSPRLATVCAVVLFSPLAIAACGVPPDPSRGNNARLETSEKASP
jgi:hypothetical protein